MKRKLIVFTLLAGFVLFAFTGCGSKISKSSGASPSSSASSSGLSTANVSTIIGIAGDVTSQSITLSLVKEYDATVTTSQSATSSTAASPSVAAVSPSAAKASASVSSSPSLSTSASASPSASASAASPSTSAAALIGNANKAYAMTGKTQTIAPTSSTLVILETQGYIAGTLSNIERGDFLAVVLSDNTVISIIDNGPGTEYSSTYNGTTGGSSSAMGGTSTSAKPSTSPGVTSTGAAVIYTVAVDDLNIRSGPGTSYESLGKLKKGTQVTGTLSGSWVKVNYNGKTGYLSLENLTAAGSGTASSSASPSPSAVASGVTDNATSASYSVTNETLNVRSGPGTTYESLGKLSKGDKVTGTITGGWLKLDYKGKTGYVSAQYLSLVT